MAGTSDYRWRAPIIRRNRDAAGAQTSALEPEGTQAPARPITLPRVSFLDDENAAPKTSNSGGLDRLRDG